MQEKYPFDFRKPEDQELFDLALTEEEKQAEIESAHEEALGIILAKAKTMEYQAAGEPDLVSGVTSDKVYADGDNDSEYVHGRRVLKGGYGTYLVAGEPSHFILKVKVKAKDEKGEEIETGKEIWTERDFRLALGVKRLTEKVRKAIEEEMPEYVAVDRYRGQKGTIYYRLAEYQVDQWADRVRPKLKTKKT